jgi:hypothetical protein
MSSALYGLMGRQSFMPETTTSGDTIYGDTENQENKENTDQGSDSEPVARYKISPLTLTVFERKIDGNIFHETSLQRAYPKDDNGDEFGFTNSLRPRDLRKASELFRKAANDLQQFSLQQVDSTN